MIFGRNLVYATFLALLLATLVLSQAHLANAEDYWALPESAEETTPVKAGDRAPGFTVRTVDDEPYVFDPDNLARPTILISFRGGWCPYCNMHLSELRTVIPEIRESGFDVLFLSNDRPEILYSSLRRSAPPSGQARDLPTTSTRKAGIMRGRQLASTTHSRYPQSMSSTNPATSCTILSRRTTRSACRRMICWPLPKPHCN
jgi:hypothetical protein